MCNNDFLADEVILCSAICGFHLRHVLSWAFQLQIEFWPLDWIRWNCLLQSAFLIMKIAESRIRLRYKNCKEFNLVTQKSVYEVIIQGVIWKVCTFEPILTNIMLWACTPKQDVIMHSNVALIHPTAMPSCLNSMYVGSSLSMIIEL